MLEIVKAILDILGKAINLSDISASRKHQKLTQLGSKLFLLYLRLNEIIICADGIVTNLENSLKYSENSRSLAESLQKDVIADLISLQRINLKRFISAVDNMSNELQILDGSVYRQLIPLVIGKNSVLDWLEQLIRHGKLPLNSATTSELIAWIETKIQDTTFTAKVDRFGSGFDNRFLILEIQQLIEKDKSSLIFINQSWDDKVYSLIKNYLEERKPRTQIEELIKVAEKLENSLEETFSVQEILLEINASRAKNGLKS